MKSIDSYWQAIHPVTLLLLPLAALFGLLSGLRRLGYRLGVLKSVRLPVPVIVVGNISVGGTGKTPLVVWLVDHLQEQGFKPGVISRGYGGRSSFWPRSVNGDSDPAEVGDEPVLIAQRTGCPVWVGPKRSAAAYALLAHHDCDILISDDGLQHYALERDIELVVIDAARGLGNGLWLPAGPLREGRWRLERADLVVSNGVSDLAAHQMQLVPGKLHNLADPEKRCELQQFHGAPVHALAGIGHPDRFFATLKAQGVEPIEHPFPDHHAYDAGELTFEPPYPLLMTEKDAVKCRHFAQANHWYLEVAAQLDAAFITRLDSLLRDLKHG